MSKPKLKFKEKTAPNTWCVDVYEYEKEWGRRLEDHFEFSSEQEASEFMDYANVTFSKHGSSENFALADFPYLKRKN